MILVIGCASEKKMESTATEAAQPTSAKTDATASAPAAAEQITLAVTGMTWGACVSKVQSALTQVPGVISADVSLSDSKAVVKLEKGKATTTQLTDAVKGAGFSATAAN